MSRRVAGDGDQAMGVNPASCDSTHPNELSLGKRSTHSRTIAAGVIAAQSVELMLLAITTRSDWRT